MLGNGRLFHLQSIHNLPYRPLLERQVVEYLSAARLGHSIESIGSGSRSCHERHITFLYGNMSSSLLFPAGEQSAHLTCKMQVKIATLYSCKKRTRRPS